MKKVIIFSHESDLDGLYSATIALMRYPQATAVFLGYGKENFEKIGNFIHSQTHYSREPGGGLAIISDLGLNDDVIDICSQIFSSAAKDGWEVLWIDHHPWSQKAVDSIKQVAKIVLDSSGSKCAADLMYETLLPENELARNLAAMAHTMDFFTKDRYLVPLSELIRYYQTFSNFYPRMVSLARKSASGVLWDVEMQTDYEEYTRLRDEAANHALSTTVVKPIAGFNVAFVQASPYLQNSIFSEQVFQKTGADLVMFYSSKGKVSIRRNNENISCSQIASNLPEGGGHAYAAGAVFHSNPADTQAVIAELQAAVEKALLAKANT
jgi:oligoribonuclease NrnB/cAMP/cGMP phosphodiesterase (DHH superfamily)